MVPLLRLLHYTSLLNVPLCFAQCSTLLCSAHWPTEKLIGSQNLAAAIVKWPAKLNRLTFSFFWSSLSWHHLRVAPQKLSHSKVSHDGHRRAMARDWKSWLSILWLFSSVCFLLVGRHRREIGSRGQGLKRWLSTEHCMRQVVRYRAVCG